MSSPASRRRARLARLVVTLSALSLLGTATAAGASPEQARGQERAAEVRQEEPGAHGQAQAHDNPSQERKAAAQERREQAQSQQAAAHEARDQRAEARAAQSDRAQDDEANIPSGNKGSVKVRSHGADAYPPRNEPHVDCVFDVLFYGFSSSGATASLATHAPTAPTGTDLGSQSVTWEPAQRQGNAYIDRVTFDLRGVLDNGDFTHHEQQGYHVKLTVTNHDRENGNVKHKVFWVDCAPAGPAGEVEVDDADVLGVATTSQARVSADAEAVAASVDTTEVLGLVVEADEVLGDAGVARAAGTQPAQVGTPPTTGQLAATGIGIVALLALGAALLTGGGGALGVGRRMRRR